MCRMYHAKAPWNANKTGWIKGAEEKLSKLLQGYLLFANNIDMIKKCDFMS